MMDAASRHPLSTAFLLGASLTLALGSGALAARSLLRLHPRFRVGLGAQRGAASTEFDRQWHRSIMAVLAQSEARLASRLEKEAGERGALMLELGRLRAEMARSGAAGQGRDQASLVSRGPGGEPWGWIKDRQRAAAGSAGSALANPTIDVLQEVHKGAGRKEQGDQVVRSSTIHLPGPPAPSQQPDETKASPLQSTLPAPSPVAPATETTDAAKKPVSYELPRRTYVPQYGGLRAGIGRHGPLPIVDPSNPNYM